MTQQSKKVYILQTSALEQRFGEGLLASFFKASSRVDDPKEGPSRGRSLHSLKGNNFGDSVGEYYKAS